MITAVTSKRGGTGCTSVALVYALLLSKRDRKVCVVDLRTSNDIVKLLKINTSASVDNLLSEFGVHNKFSGLEENILSQGGLDVIPGSVVPMRNYLLTKASRLKDLLLILEGRYNDVILDIEDGDLLEVLSREEELHFLNINVIDQNMLVISEYQSFMNNNNLQGLLLVNKMDDDIFPQKRLFTEQFPKGKVFFIPSSKKFRDSINREGLNLKSVSNTKVFESIGKVADVAIPIVDNYNNSIGLDTEGVDEGLVFEDENGNPINNKPKRRTDRNKEKKKFSLFGFFRKGGK